MSPSNSLWANSVLHRMTFVTLGAASASQLWLAPVEAADQSSKTYKLKVNQGIIRTEDGPSLKRGDLNNGGNPFETKNQKQDDAFQPPSYAFQVKSDKPSAPPKKDYNLHADDGGAFNGQGLPGVSDELPQQEQPQQQLEVPNLAPPTQVNNVRQNPNELDGQELKVAWDDWHNRVARAIFNQIGPAAARKIPRSEPLVCVVNYTITRDGHVKNVHLQQKSSSSTYNDMVYAVVKGMTGNPVLQFPLGSRRMTVDKLSTFKHNVQGPNGYQYITGDQETLKNQNK